LLLGASRSFIGSKLSSTPTPIIIYLPSHYWSLPGLDCLGELFLVTGSARLSLWSYINLALSPRCEACFQGRMMAFGMKHSAPFQQARTSRYGSAKKEIVLKSYVVANIIFALITVSSWLRSCYNIERITCDPLIPSFPDRQVLCLNILKASITKM